jgi:hypothetical protein
MNATIWNPSSAPVLTGLCLLTAGATWGADLPVIGQYQTGAAAIRVAASGSYAYLAADGLKIIDVSDAAAPDEVANYTPSRLPIELTVANGHAYLLLPNGIEVVDISTPEAPQHADTYEADLDMGGLVVVDGQLYLATWNTGLSILNTSNPANLLLTGAYGENPHYSSEVAVSENHAWVATKRQLRGFDVSDPANPQPVGTIAAVHDAHTVDTAGHFTYVGDFKSLQVIDVSDPSDPQRVGECPLDGIANDVAVSGDFAYVAAQGAGLVVIDISDPTRPSKVAGNSSFTAFGVAVDGDRVYVAGTDTGLMIFDAFPLPRVSVWVQQPGGGLTLSVSGRAGHRVQLQRSNDLRNWEGFQTLTLGNGPTEVEETDAELGSPRFYRAVKE